MLYCRSLDTLAALLLQEVDQKASLEKLRADSKRVKARIAKLEEEAAKIKFPVKDEVLGALLEAAAAPAATSSKSKAASAAADTSMEPRKPLPAAVLQLNSMLPDDLVNDAVGVWDFLNVFRYVTHLFKIPCALF